MCTLIVARNVFRFYPLVVAANRDERLHRPSSGPAVSEENHRMLHPVDEVFGGTWIGVNGSGVVSAITNRSSVPHVRGRTSRGLLVPEALAYGSAAEAASHLLNVPGSRHNGFHLMVADMQDAFLILGDGQRLTARPLPEGVSVITGQGWEPGHLPREGRIRSVFRREVIGHPPRRATMRAVLDLHDRPDSEWQGQTGSCLHGLPDDDWVTKSSSFIRTQDRNGERFWEFHHRERPEGLPNCEGHWTEFHLPMT